MLVAEIAHGQFVCPPPDRRGHKSNRDVHGLPRLHGARLLTREQQIVRRGLAGHHDNKPVAEAREGPRGRHREFTSIRTSDVIVV